MDTNKNPVPHPDFQSWDEDYTDLRIEEFDKA
jgi:hypothetical protein